MPIKVGILMGGASEERLISLSTAQAVNEACVALGYSVSKLLFNKNYVKFLDEMKNLDIVFNALHGGIGENGEIQKWMEKNGIKYTGSGPLASALCMDKAKSKQLVKEMHIETPPWQLLYNLEDVINIDFPLVVKPNQQGSTVGLTVVKEKQKIKSALKEAFKYDKSVIVEKYIKGLELTVPIIGDSILPIIEIRPLHNLYDYDCKYTPGMTKYNCPATIDCKIVEKINDNTRVIFNKLNCSVYARADYILDSKGVPYFLEMNTLPGMTSTSLLPKSAMAMGVTFTKLIETIIKLSL